MFKLNMFEGICSSSAETQSNVLVRIYLIFNFSSDDPDLDHTYTTKFWIRNTAGSSLGRYVFGSEISYNKAPPRLPGLGC